MSENDTPLTTRAYNLGLKAVPNFVGVLDETRIKYYEDHLDQLPVAVERGFVIPGQKLSVDEDQASLVFKVEDTDLDKQLDQAQRFAKEFLGVGIDFRKRFVIPKTVPWPSVLPVFDPGGLTNRDMFKLLKKLGHNPYEETDVMRYDGSEANKSPTLRLIANSVKPDAWTLTNQGISPNEFLATNKRFLDLRGYGLAFVLRHAIGNDYLDTRTFTWFPENRLADGHVAYGYWNPDYGQVRFYWNYPANRRSNGGARVAISCGSLT